MTMDAKIESLKRKHATLEQEIGGEVHRPVPDQSMISELKREKLKLKDEISDLEHA